MGPIEGFRNMNHVAVVDFTIVRSQRHSPPGLRGSVPTHSAERTFHLLAPPYAFTERLV